MALLFETIPHPIYLGVVLLLAGYGLYAVYDVVRPSNLPKLPIAGAKDGEWFPLFRARRRNFKDFKSAIMAAYEKYGKAGQTCVFAVSASADLVVIPHTEHKWLIDQPDSVLSIDASMMDKVQLHYTFFNQGVLRHPVHHELLHKRLTREVGNMIPDLLDEIRAATDECWGIDTDTWKEVCVYETMRPVLGRTINRAFVGKPLCRDPKLMGNGVAFAQDMPLAATLLKLIWSPLRPFAAPFITLPNRIHTHKFHSVLKPEIQRRIMEWEIRNSDPEKQASQAGAPLDFLEWMIQQAKEIGDPWYLQWDTLASRLLLLNFAAIHSSSWAITHAIVDLASYDPNNLQVLRHEISEVLSNHGGEWNKRSLAQMVKLDSFMRESQRLNTLSTVATSRKVVAPGGVETPSGVHLPYGATLVNYSLPIFHDPDLYPSPYDFQPFRFAETRQKLEAEGKRVEAAQQAWATTSETYTSFGHGRHACPGRFFASTDLKLLLGHVIVNYDFEMKQGERPANVWFGLNKLPPMKATVKIRRRAPGSGREKD